MSLVSVSIINAAEVGAELCISMAAFEKSLYKEKYSRAEQFTEDNPQGRT